LEKKLNVADVSLTLLFVMVVSGGVVSAASARFSVVATNANKASNGTSRIIRLLNIFPPQFAGLPSMPYFFTRLPIMPYFP
jgi:hypothetical protein